MHISLLLYLSCRRLCCLRSCERMFQWLPIACPQPSQGLIADSLIVQTPVKSAFHTSDFPQQILFRRALSQRWNMPLELAHDLATLALYDIVIFADDSGSMIFEEGGERINDLKVIMGRVAEVATLFDEDGMPCLSDFTPCRFYRQCHVIPCYHACTSHHFSNLSSWNHAQSQAKLLPVVRVCVQRAE